MADTMLRYIVADEPNSDDEPGWSILVESAEREPLWVATVDTEEWAENLVQALQDGRTKVLDCGCVPHVTRMRGMWGFYCETEDQGYCNFECPHEDEE